MAGCTAMCLHRRSLWGCLARGRRGITAVGGLVWNHSVSPHAYQDTYVSVPLLTLTGIPADFWETTPVREVLTDEESTLLSNSATERHSLGQEISLCTKMLQLIDLAIKRRDHLIASSLKLPKAQVLGKDFCAYDYRLDSVGASAAFAAFFKSPAGEAIFKTLKLPLPGDEGFVEFVPDEGYIYPADHDRNGVRSPQGLASVLCTRRKCKPHAGWSGIHTKNVKHQIKELAAQAKERLDFEARITDCAAVRFQRRKRENNRVEVVDRDVEMGG